VVSFPIPEIDWRDVLTPAEAAVAEDALAGLDNTQIALKRGAAVRTVANQLASIYRKLEVRSRLELSLYALAGRRTFGKKPE
jgi:DNA-binding NarL/FixJ family response regulator